MGVIYSSFLQIAVNLLPLQKKGRKIQEKFHFCIQKDLDGGTCGYNFAGIVPVNGIIVL
jgi:hypothetical protein